MSILWPVPEVPESQDHPSAGPGQGTVFGTPGEFWDSGPGAGVAGTGGCTIPPEANPSGWGGRGSSSGSGRGGGGNGRRTSYPSLPQWATQHQSWSREMGDIRRGSCYPPAPHGPARETRTRPKPVHCLGSEAQLFPGCRNIQLFRCRGNRKRRKDYRGHRIRI